MTEYMGTADVATRLGVHRNAIIKWSNEENRLPESLRQGSTRLYRSDYIEAVARYIVQFEGKWWSVDPLFFYAFHPDISTDENPWPKHRIPPRKFLDSYREIIEITYKKNTPTH